MQTWIDIKFADGEYTFKLGLAQISELERKCNDGIGAIYARTTKGRYGYLPGEGLADEGQYRFPELIEIIRQCLIGGGAGVVDGSPVKVSSIRANDLIDAYLIGATDQRMTASAIWALAYTALRALIEGYDPPKKGEPGVIPAPLEPSPSASTTSELSTTAP